MEVGALTSGSNDQEDLFILSVRPERAECRSTGSAELRLRVYGKNAKQSCDIPDCSGGFLGEGHKDLEGTALF